ncbi:beta/gamma crystallin-related protein [Brevundimonas sp. UBA2416]|uniref:beta/gamma crystallin-related protein n=1 Tax=Brevundimonas sp. UBA2416 TaxID=1946124 RepID=UPI0025B7DAF6|nr:beta/gamma crystallin-related protein [Brevundimonas sp. UBA2416]HRJ63371.1 beta/gamma crystallin-related protein [Brevundimonas sp.]
MLIEMLAAAAVVTGAGQEFAPQIPGGPERVAPRGDYRDSCSGEYVNRGRLYADCRTNRGQIRGTSIELNRCGNYEIRNNDGLLVCGPNRGEYEDRPGGGGRPDRPGGGWGGGRSSVTIFRDADYRGASFRFDNEMPNLANTGFNDAISSMRFQGTWEACTDAYYRGQCVTFSNDVRNLRNTGLNDRISSLRPVRGGGRW